MSTMLSRDQTVKHDEKSSFRTSKHVHAARKDQEKKKCCWTVTICNTGKVNNVLDIQILSESVAFTKRQSEQKLMET